MRRTSTLIMLICWALAAGATIFLLFGKQEADGVRLSVTPQDETVETIEAATTLTGARYTGQSNDGTKWDIFAKEAESSGTSTDAIANLRGLTATLFLPDNTPINIQARYGSYNAKQEKLDLAGNVNVQGQGLTLKTENLSTVLKQNNLSSTGNAIVKGTLGSWDIDIIGQNLTANFTKNNQFITLSKGVKTVFIPK